MDRKAHHPRAHRDSSLPHAGKIAWLGGSNAQAMARCHLAAALTWLASGVAQAGVIAVDQGIPTDMNAGGTQADPAIYHVGAAAGVVVNQTTFLKYLGNTKPWNRLIVDNAARLSMTGQLRVGEEIGAFGNSIFVSGPGTEMSVSTTFLGLYEGQNQLRLENGAHLVSGSLWSGYYKDSNDNAMVATGATTLWEAETVGVGSQGSRNSLLVEAAARVQARTFTVGSAALAANNRATVDGAGSKLDITFQGFVGGNGINNRLEILRGGQLTAASMQIGSDPTASGNELLADGNGSGFQIAENRLGGLHSASNSLVIRNQAQGQGNNCIVGLYETSDLNQLRIEGRGSSHRLSGDLTLGVSGDENAMRVTGGGEARNRNAKIGQGDEGNPTYGFAMANRAIIEDPGSKWVNEGDLSIGEYGKDNAVEIRRGGLVVVEGNLEIDKLRRGGNHLLLDGGYLAWKGDQSAHVGRFSGSVVDTRATQAGAFGYQYFATDAAAQAATGIAGLGGYTVLGAGTPRIPPPVADWRLRIPNPRDSENDDFPSSISVRGHYALVGASTAVSVKGAAFLIDLENGNLIREFSPPSLNIGERPAFGNSVALTDQHAIVAASDKDEPGASYSGAVYVFDRLTGALLYNLRPSDPAGGQRFGSSISAHGDTLLVGAWGDRSSLGAGYLFDLKTGSQLSKLVTPATTGARVGSKVALDGSRAALTASNGGRTYYAEGQIWLFDVSDPRQPSAPTLIPHPRLAELDYQESAGFGSALALQGGLLLAGAAGEDSDTGMRSAGAAYLIDVSNVQAPQALRRIVSPQPEANDHFGDSVAISGNTAVISNAFIDRPTVNVGEVRVLDISTPSAPVDLGAIAAPPDQYAFGFIVAMDAARVVACTRSSLGSIVGALHSHVLPDPQVRAVASTSTTASGAVTHTVTVSNPAIVDITSLTMDCAFLMTGADAAIVDEVVVTTGTIENGKWSIPRLGASQTAELRVTYKTDNHPETGGTLATSARITGSEEFLLGRQDDASSVETRITAVVTPKTVLLDAYPVVNRQTGLMVQRVSVTNQSDTDLPNWWLTVTGLPSNVQVRSATGQDEAGRAIVPGPSPLLAGAEVIVTVEFYSPLRDPRLQPVYGIGFPDPAPAPAGNLATQPGNGTPPRIERQSGGNMLIDFAVETGREYQVEYSDDLSTWRTAGEPILATAARIQWIDRGPPETESPPASVSSRFYRVVPLAAE